MGVIKKQSILSTIVIYAGVLLGFLNIGILMPKFFTPAEIGVRSLLVDFTTIFVTFSFLGFNNGMLKYYADYKEGNKIQGYFMYFFILSFVSLSVFLLLLYCLEDSILKLYGESSVLFTEYFPYIYSLAIYFTFNVLFENIFKSVKDIFLTSLVKEVVLRILFLVLIVSYYMKWIDFSLFIALFCITYLLVSVILLMFLLNRKILDFKIKKELFSLKFNRKLFKFSLTTFVSSAGYLLVFKLDTLMIGGLLGTAEIDGAHFVGLYSMALFFVATIDIPRRSVFQINTPMIVEYFSTHRLEKIQEIYKKTSNTLGAIGVGLACLLVISLDQILEIIPNGYRFIEIYWVVVSLCVSRVMFMIFSVGGDIILYSKYYRYNMIFIAVLLLISIFFNYFLIRNYGINGAALATFLSLFIFCMMRFLFIKKKFGFELFDKKIVYIICSGVFFAFLLTNIPMFSNSYIMLGIKTVLFSIIYLSLLYRFEWSNEIKVILKQGLTKFSK